MPSSTSPRPTQAELAILRVLWCHGPCTVRQVHERLGQRKTRYTTTLKQLQLMVDKNLVRRDASERRHVYSAAVKETTAKRSLVKEFLERVFEGSLGNLVLHALDAKHVSQRELEDIRLLLDQHKREKAEQGNGKTEDGSEIR